MDEVESGKLLTVTHTFDIQGRGLVVAPDVDLGDEYQLEVEVELRRPDGTVLRATALGQMPMINPPNPRLRHMLLFRTLSKQDVPVGTQVWRAEKS
ncbi:hypothetical protein ACLESO_10255 [Pyxidicoccus sp. 3LG]